MLIFWEKWLEILKKRIHFLFNFSKTSFELKVKHDLCVVLLHNMLLIMSNVVRGYQIISDRQQRNQGFRKWQFYLWQIFTNVKKWEKMDQSLLFRRSTNTFDIGTDQSDHQSISAVSLNSLSSLGILLVVSQQSLHYSLSILH